MQDHLTLEQLSGLLDEEATDDVRGHVATCDRCDRALERMRSARAFIGEEVTLPAAAIGSAVAAAVAALAPSNVKPLETRHRRNPLPWLAGVAAVLVGILGLGALVLGPGRGGGDEDLATTADIEAGEAFDDSTGVQGGAGGATAAEDGGGALTEGAAQDGSARSAAPPPQRAFDTEDQVIAYLQEDGDAMPTTATACSDEATAALGAPLERLRSEDVLWQAGSAALWVDPNQRRAVLMRPGGCSLLADLQY